MIQNLIIITTITIMLLFNELQLEKEIYYPTVVEKVVWLNSKFYNNHNNHNNHKYYLMNYNSNRKY